MSIESNDFRRLLEKKIADDRAANEYWESVNNKKSFLKHGYFDEEGIELLFYYCQEVWASLNAYPESYEVQNNNRYVTSGAGYFLGLHRECGGKFSSIAPKHDLVISQKIYNCILTNFRIDGIVDENFQFIWRTTI